MAEDEPVAEPRVWKIVKAATILVHLDPGNPAGQGKSLPEDKSLWPAAGELDSAVSSDLSIC